MSKNKQSTFKIVSGILIVIGILIFNFFNDKNIEPFDSQQQVNQAQAEQLAPPLDSVHTNQTTELNTEDDSKKIQDAFNHQLNDVQVKATGTLKKILPDDNEGSRHQRFILELNTGDTILIAHNIDLAPRIENLAVGDQVEFYGVYEYNPQGGVVHWTHHDPRGKHIGGWLKHQNKTYE